MSFVLVVRMSVAEGKKRLAAGELFGLMESRERTFYETVVD